MRKWNVLHIGIILLVFAIISLNVLMILGSVLNPIIYTRDYVMIPGIRAFIEAYNLWWLVIELALIGVCGAYMVYCGVKRRRSGEEWLI